MQMSCIAWKAEKWSFQRKPREKEKHNFMFSWAMLRIKSLAADETWKGLQKSNKNFKDVQRTCSRINIVKKKTKRYKHS